MFIFASEKSWISLFCYLMRRIICGTICACVVLLLWSCSNKANESESSGSEVRAADSAKVLTARADSFRKVMNVRDTVKQDSAAQESPKKQNGVYMSMWGRAGETGFLFDMAQAKEYGERRQLKLVSYNPTDGACVINAYLRGKYIGQFRGTFNEEDIEMDDGGSHYVQAYGGVFTSAKGAKVDFSFYFD